MAMNHQGQYSDEKSYKTISISSFFKSDTWNLKIEQKYPYETVLAKILLAVTPNDLLELEIFWNSRKVKPLCWRFELS